MIDDDGEGARLACGKGKVEDGGRMEACQLDSLDEERRRENDVGPIREGV